MLTESEHRPPMRPSPAFPIFFVLPLALLLGTSACGPDEADAPPPDQVGTGSLSETEAAGPAASVNRATFEEALASGHAALTYFYVPSSGFAYHDPEGRLTGVTAELLRDFARFVANTHGIHVEVEWVEEERWADFYGYVRESEGGAFGIGNVTITDPRGEEVDFSPPYLQNIAVLVTHTDVPELEAIEEIGRAFVGLTALPYPGTLHETRLEAIRENHLPEMTTHPVASNDELVSLIASGEGYVGYMDIYNYWRARENGLPLRRHPVGDDAAEAFGVILPNDSDWTPVMEAFFHEDGGYVESPRYREHLRIHLGEELAGLLGGR